MTPSVSVVICNFNHEAFVNEALDSVAAQTLHPTQLIITDDASTDRSPQLIRSWVADRWPDAELLFNTSNSGLPAMLNKVVPHLRGDLTMLMAADDRMHPNKIERQVAAFVAGGTSLGMVYSDMIEIDASGVATGQRWFDLDRMGPVPGEGNLFDYMIRRACMAAPTVMMRTELLRTAGPYDESLVAEDYDMFLRLSRLANWAYIDSPLVEYRVLSSSLSRSTEFRDSVREGRIRMLRKHLGVSDITDRVIADRIAQMSKSLYFEGRPGRATAADLREAISVRARLRDLVLLGLAAARVPGPTVARAVRLASQVRASVRKRL